MKNKERQQALEDAMKQLSDNSGLLKNNENVQKFIKERMEIEKTLKKKNPLVKEYLALFKDAEKRPYTNIGRMAKEMKDIAAKQEILKIAVELCTNEDAKKELIEQRNKLQQSPAIISYEKYMQGLKYLAGMTNEVQPEVRRFFEEDMRVVLFDKESEYESYRTGMEEPAIDEKEKLKKTYQNAMAPVKAKQLFAKQAQKFEAIERQFIGNYIKNPNRIRESYHTDRVDPSSYCVGLMLQKGYSLDNILDPRALLEEKKEVGKKYIEIRESKDANWYTEEMYKNSEAMIKGFQEYVKKYKKELKTEQDLTQHMPKLGMLAKYCFDNFQEIRKCMKVVIPKGDFTFKTEEELNNMVDNIERYSCFSGTSNTRLEYDLERVTPLDIVTVMDIQLAQNGLLQEIQKDEPDYDAILLDGEQRTTIRNQISTLPELKAFFKDGSPDMDELDAEDVVTIVSMLNTKYIEENNITCDKAKTPLTITKEPKHTIGFMEDLAKGKKIDVLLSFDGKPIIKTNVPAKVDKYLQRFEKKNLRGKEKDNSKEFNTLLKNYDKTIKNLKGKDILNDVDSRKEMEELKKAASEYLTAKRAQKGYQTEKTVDKKIDDKMLGKSAEKGASIFTSKGKERYAFALNILKSIEEIEKGIAEFEKEKSQKELEDNGLGMH